MEEQPIRRASTWAAACFLSMLLAAALLLFPVAL